MKINVLFFGATAELAGSHKIETAVSGAAVAANVIEDLTIRYPILRDHKLLFAVNEEYVAEDFPLKDGDELAIFTAVSGG